MLKKKAIDLRFSMLENVHSTWHDILLRSFLCMSDNYLDMLEISQEWLPGKFFLLRAFQQPLDSTRFILIGESPYPRAQSANGYAFWDSAVKDLWSNTGLSKPVNRATSLRNIIKMLLHARGDLGNDFSQAAIARLDSSMYCSTVDCLFRNWVKQGFLLLNASLVYMHGQIPYHARQWRPFMSCLFKEIAIYCPWVKVLVLGRVAEKVTPEHVFDYIKAEHPYHTSFITNQTVLDFFRPLNLLEAHDDNKH